MAIIKLQQAPSGSNAPQTYFDKNDFDETIWKHGYNVIIEKALKCPCKSTGSDNLSNCKNCGGTGWIFINPIQTKAVLRSQNLTTKFKDWSEINIGNVNITVRDIDKLAFMDRLTVLDGESIHTQNATLRMYEGVLFAFLDYDPKCVSVVFLFKDPKEKLIHLNKTVDYTIIDSKIILDTKFIKKGQPMYNDMTISLRYIHAPQYHVIDIMRDVIVSPTAESFGNQITQMPISAQGRRAHYVLNRQNFEGNLILDNSYQKLCVEDECDQCKCLNNNL
jgi:hypothetical protein